MIDRAKSLMMARLALARASLWLQCLGLSEETLTRQRALGLWTLKDLLAHAAAWDNIWAVQIGLIQAGRLHQIQQPDQHALDVDLYRQRHTWPLEFVIAETQNARARVLFAVEDLTWDEIAYEHRTSSGARRAICDLLYACVEHDTGHAADLLAWRAGRAPAPGPKIVLRAGHEACRAALAIWRQVLPAKSYATQLLCDDLTWQDVLGHVADWDLFCVRNLQDLAAGRPADLSFASDEMAWVAARAAARRGEPYAKTWDDFVDAHWQVGALLDSLDDAQLAQPTGVPIPSLSTWYAWFSTCAFHYYQHARWLREALDGPGG